MHKYNFLAFEDGVLGIMGWGLTAHPGVPTQARAAARTFCQLTGRDFLRLQDQLHIKIQLRADVQPHQMDQHEERLALRSRRAVRQEFLKLNIAQWSQANANFALHVPNALAGDDTDAETAAALSQ